MYVLCIVFYFNNFNNFDKYILYFRLSINMPFKNIYNLRIFEYIDKYIPAGCHSATGCWLRGRNQVA